MDFNEYQKQIVKFDTYEQTPNLITPNFLEKILGLTGEAGEVSDKFKKIIRDRNAKITLDDKEDIKKELGDTLWYIATIARYLDIPFSDIAEANVKKLDCRLNRNKIHGSGDNR